MHNCIHCDNFEMIPLSDGQLPVMQKFTCDKCQTTQWIKHSRVAPETYSEDMVEVDEENHSIKLKDITDKKV